MKKLIIALAAGSAALFVGSASAAPLNPMTMHVDNGVENVRLVCDQSGRCRRQRGGRRMMIQRQSNDYDQSYAYDRRQPYYQDRGSYYQDRSGPGIGVQVPGVSIGIGGGRW